jgi:hypothetical protein
MKHVNIQPHHSDTLVPGLTDAETEARVFRNLEAKQRAWEKETDGAVVIIQCPDKRSVSQRFAAWWRLRRHPPGSYVDNKHIRTATEPAWSGHWATVKYL